MALAGLDVHPGGVVHVAAVVVSPSFQVCPLASVVFLLLLISEWHVVQ